MLGKYFIFSIRRPAATTSFFAALVVVAQLLIAFGFLVSPSNGIPVALPDETSSSTTAKPASTTVKILIPPSQNDDAEDDDAVIIEAGNGTASPLPKEPFHPSDCFMDKEKGPCRAIIDMWFFNVASKSCEQFQYSGCGGNGNRFSEKTECESYCGRGGKSIGTGEETDKDTSDDAIVIEAASDEDNTNGTCPQFDGCGPLKCAVIKDEKTGCKKCACSHHGGDNAEGPVGSVSGTPSEDDDAKMKKEKPEDICGLAEVRGSCRAMLTRFRYDSKLKKCIMFHFGGCDSNGNNFVSEDKCNEFCRGQ